MVADVIRVSLLACGLCLASSGFVGCGDDQTVAMHDGGGPPDLSISAGAHPSGTVSEPAEHRATAAACPARPASPTCPSSGVCKTDADCTAGRNGRCALGAIYSCACTYDECDSDADCTAGRVCACRLTLRGLTNGNGPNRCVPANCTTDADCGAGGFCSPTMSGGSCQSYVEGYYCHTPNDVCGNAADCITDGIGYPLCVYAPDLASWVCRLGGFCSG